MRSATRPMMSPESVGGGPGHVKPTFESETQAAHDPATLAPDTETVAYDFDSSGTADFTRVIDRSQDSLGRDTGWQLKDGSTVENQSIYAYGATDGRLASVGNGVETFTYGYLANSSLLATVTGPAHTVTNTYDTTRNVLASKENEVGSTLISGYSYTVNAIGQRTNVVKTGSAFSSARDIAWGYDALGQVISADSTIPGLDRGYRYDTIGNRIKSADGTTDPDDPSATGYAVNALNQYSGIGSLTPSYDDDGNATAYPLPANLSANSTLVWDGENRLIEAQVSGGGTVTYLYDSQSRRIAETVGSATKITIYDGWNPVAEYGASYALTKTYTWGVDLSGSMQGAGGVGGLLAVHDGTATHFPTYDGNSNVSEYLDDTGAVVAHYEYDPFGKTTVATGSKANDFAHRFSTKPLDATTGLYYYGYRFYDPVTGRWPSRDPLEENWDTGEFNEYAFILNDGLNAYDLLGLAMGFGAETPETRERLRGKSNKMSENDEVAVVTVTIVATILTPVPGDEVGVASMLGVKIGSKCCRSIKVALDKVFRIKRVNPNDLNHIFGKKGHKLDDFLNDFGGNQEKAFRAMEKAVKQKKPCPGQVFEVQISVKSHKITARGRVLPNGDVKIGTAFKP